MPRVLHIAAEIYPLVKVGGLGDVMAALPPALARTGVDTRVLVPGYPAVLKAAGAMEPVARIPARFGGAEGWLLSGRLDRIDVPAYVVDLPEFFDRPGNPYMDRDNRDYADNWARFAALARAAADLADGADADWRPDIVHGHDWQSGLMPAYLAARGGARPATAMTIHNLAYQGNFPAERFADLDLPASQFGVDGVEYYGQVSYLKAGLMQADRITTVSRTYAQEIQTPDAGFGFDGILRARVDRLSGIVNGVDTGVWDPTSDPNLPVGFSAEAPAGKLIVRQALAAEMGLAPAWAGPIFGVVSRLNDLKGLDLLLEALPSIIRNGGTLALLGSGDKALEDGFTDAARRYPGRVAIRLGYDEALAHRIIGGADVVLVPSRSEPCGLTQLYGLRYGTLPLVRRTGGLADTVTNASPDNRAAGRATGFVFDDATAPALAGTLDWACKTYADVTAWGALQRRAMSEDVSWDRSARDYAALYADMLSASHGSTVTMSRPA